MMNLLSFGIAPGNSILLFDVPSSMNQINKEACQQLYEALEALKQLKTLSLRYVETAATVLWMVWEYFAIQVCNLDFSPKKTEPSAYINHVLVFYILISWVIKDFQSKWLRFCPLLQLQSNYWRKLWQDLWDTYGRIIHARAWSTVMYAAVLQQTIQGSISLPLVWIHFWSLVRCCLTPSLLIAETTKLKVLPLCAAPVFLCRPLQHLAEKMPRPELSKGYKANWRSKFIAALSCKWWKWSLSSEETSLHYYCFTIDFQINARHQLS